MTSPASAEPAPARRDPRGRDGARGRGAVVRADRRPRLPRQPRPRRDRLDARPGVVPALARRRGGLLVGRTSRSSGRAWLELVGRRRADRRAGGFPKEPAVHGHARHRVARTGWGRCCRTPTRADERRRDRPPRRPTPASGRSRHRPARVVDGRDGLPADPADRRRRSRTRRRRACTPGWSPTPAGSSTRPTTPDTLRRRGRAARVRVRPRAARAGALRGRRRSPFLRVLAAALDRSSWCATRVTARVDVHHRRPTCRGRRDAVRDRRPDRRGPHGARGRRRLRVKQQRDGLFKVSLRSRGAHGRRRASRRRTAAAGTAWPPATPRTGTSRERSRRSWPPLRAARERDHARRTACC